MVHKRDCIISAVNQRNSEYLKRTHKFGIEVPKTVAEAIFLDENNDDNLWKDEIAKETKNVIKEFKILAEGGKPPHGHQKFRCHMIFNIKMEDFRRKLRLVENLNVTKT